MNPALVEQIKVLMSRLEGARSRIVVIDESISRRREEEWGHDRHFATSSRCSLKLSHVGWAISGSCLTLHGSCEGQDCWYQMVTDCIVYVELSDDAAVVVEQFEQHTERQSTIKFGGESRGN